MSPEFTTVFRTHRALQATAAVAVVLALVGIAKLVSSHSAKPVISSKASAMAAANAAKVPADLALGPNETLVLPAAKPEGPLMPHYSTPAPPPPAPAARDRPQSPEEASAEAKAAMVEPPPQMAPLPEPAAVAQPAAIPMPPQFGPRPPSTPSYCPRCGEVVALTVWPDMAEVRVRFQDGSTHTMRGPVPSPWRIGDHVRAEQGRLVPD